MNPTEDTHLTHHAMLVAWGQYAHCIGLISALEATRLRQKTVRHRPQTKVLEFLVAMLGGFPYLKDISRSAHPLDKDQTVAQAWGQPGWADHSGVSRTLSQLSDEEVSQISEILDHVSQPMIDREVVMASGAGRIELDGDLSPRPVSATSTTYPGASFGRMSNGVGLGYQAAVVSMSSPTYGRIGLSAVQHPGSTVAATQAEALALAAEDRIGRRPLRRTDLLAQRIQGLLVAHEQLSQKAGRAQQRLTQAETDLAAVESCVKELQEQVQALQAEYERRQRPERPYSKLAKARKRLDVYQRRLMRRQGDVSKAQAWLAGREAHLVASQDEITRLQKRLQRFQEDNIANDAPIRAVLRLDAGFGTAENIALLIEMGYEVYSKPHGTWLSSLLAQRSAELDDWQRVGKNAEMVAWKQVPLDDFPYPLDLARQRFWTGQAYRHSGLLHFGQDDVTADLPAWFHYYNARQCIEAGNKEARQVFEVHHLKVRAPAALQLQERFALFAANFVRFAAHWLAEQCPQIPDGWKESSQPRVKEQVKVGANTSAWVRWLDQDCLLMFEDRSVYAGRSLLVKRLWAFQPVLPFTKSYFFSSI